MNKRFLGVLAFATIVATVASLLLYRLLIDHPQPARVVAASTQIVVAARDIEVGEVGAVLKEQDLKLSDWPGSFRLAPVSSSRMLPGVAS